MKKNLIYIIPGLMAIAILLLFFTGNNKKSKTADQRITLKRQDKIPYGTYVAYENLGYLFPEAKIMVNRREPGFWDSLSRYDEKQALIIITGQLNADEHEMKALVSFVEKGNTVFVSARTLSWNAKEMMDCRADPTDMPDELNHAFPNDSLHLFLNQPPYDRHTGFYYSGKALDATFLEIDETKTEILGEDEKGRPNFIRLRAGKGNMFIHLAPLAFSNHFLLYRNNMDYYEKILSVIPADVTKLVWDEFYLNKKFIEDETPKKGWFSVLSKYPGLKAALLTAILSLLIYVLLEMRRKQRYIPVVTKPRNDSLDFVKTIGRLYFDKGDHLNLSRKMSAYFQEYVRNKYQLATSLLDEDFIQNLKFKSGGGESTIREIVSFIKFSENAEAVSDKQLANFHKQLETFYKSA